MIPEGWKKVKWGDIATLEYGKSLNNYQGNIGNVPVYGTNGLIGYTERPLCNFPSVIIGRKGAYRGVHYSKIPFFVIDTAFYLKPIKSDLNLKFAYYQILTKNINEMDSGSAIPSTSRKDFYNLDLLLPDKENQEKITSILSSLDDKIDLNLKMNRTIEAIAQAIFKEWFVGRENISISEVIEVNPKESVKPGSLLKYVEMSDLSNVGCSIRSYVKREFSAGSKFRLLDTLLARITPCLENGKTGLVDFLDPKEVAFGSTEFIVLRPKTGISPYYVYLLSREPNFRAHAIKSMSGTSGRQRVQTDILKNFAIPDIDCGKMQRFDLMVTPLFEQIKNNSNENSTLTSLRNVMLPKLMSGNLRV